MKNMFVLGGILSFLLLSSCKKDASSPASSGSGNAELVSLAESYGFKPAAGAPDSLSSLTLTEFEKLMDDQQAIFANSTEVAGGAYPAEGSPDNLSPTLPPGSLFSNSITWGYVSPSLASAGFPSVFTVTFNPPASGLPTGSVVSSTLMPQTTSPSTSWSYRHLSGSLPGTGAYLTVQGRETETVLLSTGPFTASWGITAACNQTSALITVTPE